jgi:hypothetical protein
VRKRPTRDGVGVRGGGCVAFAERLRAGVAGTVGNLKVSDSVEDASRDGTFFTLFGWASVEPSSPFALFLVTGEAEEDSPFVLVTEETECLADRRRDIQTNQMSAGQNIGSIKCLAVQIILPGLTQSLCLNE